MGALSGGWQKRLAIARELAGAPDVLLLDEPTNHLDVDGILWLEEVLAEQARARWAELESKQARRGFPGSLDVWTPRR